MASRLLPWFAGFAGVGLVVAALRNENPLDVFLSTFSGSGAAPRSLVSAPGGSVAAPAPLTTNADRITTPTLVALPGKNGHRLAPAAAAAFAKAEQIFGQPIPITDSYRDYATQLRGYRSDPGRFGSPDTSYHVKGAAVDVNLRTLAASPTGDAVQQARWKRLYDAMTAAGWCNPRGPYRGDHKEPWHFSFGGCG